MKPYSQDLRTRIVEAVQQGTSKSGAARLFGVSLSSVKRYVRIANRGSSLEPRKGGGRPPKTDQTTEKLLEEDTSGSVRRRPSLRGASFWSMRRARALASPPSDDS
jgi:transposase